MSFLQAQSVRNWNISQLNGSSRKGNELRVKVHVWSPARVETGLITIFMTEDTDAQNKRGLSSVKHPQFYYEQLTKDRNTSK